MGISKRVYQRLRLIGYGTVPDFFCCSAEYRQQINRRTNPCPTPSHLPPLSKVRCCRPKKFGRLPEGLSHLPYPFRFSDTSVNNLSFRTKPSQNRTIARKALSHLPPLSKGGGLTAKHKLLLCCVLIAYPRPFYHQTFLPSRRRDCYIPSPHTNPSKPALSHPLFVL